MARPAIHRSKQPLDCYTCELRAFRMFCNLEAVALADFSAMGSAVVFEAKQHIFEQQEPAQAVYVICTGKVKLSCTGRNGQSKLLRLALPGEVLGLAAVMGGTTYEASAQAAELTEAKRIARKDFLAFTARHAEAGLHSANAISGDYLHAIQDTRRLALSGSIAGRLANLLLEWSRDASCHGLERFPLVLTHEEIGDLLGTSRESVTRELNRFRRDHLIDVHGHSAQILARDRLEHIAN